LLGKLPLFILFHPFSSFFILFLRKRQKKAEKGREGIPGKFYNLSHRFFLKKKERAGKGYQEGTQTKKVNKKSEPFFEGRATTTTFPVPFFFFLSG